MRRPGRSALLAAVGIAIAALSFVWGFRTHRDKTFPYAPLRAVAQRLGMDLPLEQHRKEVLSRSDSLRAVASLPYVEATFDPEAERSGVLVHDRERAFEGLNFYNSAYRSAAYLIDMDGKLVHEWSYALGRQGWHHAELLPDGKIVVVVKDQALLELDRDSRLLWSRKGRFHHDVGIDTHGDIVASRRRLVSIPEIHPTNKVLCDSIVFVSSRDGAVKDEISILDLVRNSPYAFLLPSIHDRTFKPDDELDIFHNNHVEVFDGRLAHLSPLFRKGNILISMKSLDAIAIVDGERRKIVWLWGPTNVARQHDPTLLPSGRILLFDNGHDASRVLELDPLTRAITWSYAPGKSFFSEWGGANQRLPNGNTLITASTPGYVYEVTPGGEIVWSYANPEVDEQGKRLNIWRMTRFLPSELPFLRTPSDP